MPATCRRQRLRALPLLVLLPIALAASLLLTGPASASSDSRTARAKKIAYAVQVAKNQAGDPYVYGAAGPNAFDCSGLTMFSFKKAGLYLPRTAAGQYQHVRHIKKSNVRRGDLVFFHDSGGRVYHAAIFAGRFHGAKLIWHAPHTGTVVKRDRIWTSAWYAGTLRR